jgi:RES domain-containing protein
MKLSGCSALTPGPLTGTWFRAINHEFWTTRLSTDHTRFKVSRFSLGNPGRPTFRILFLAESQHLALFEISALLGDPSRPVSDPSRTITLLNLSVRLNCVVDLTDAAEQRRIGTTAQELTGGWKQYALSGEAPTQRLGQALFDVAGLEGFLVPSARVETARNLVVFPDKLNEASRIEFRNPKTRRLERLG